MIPRRNTLRARFALWVAGLLLVTLIGFGALVYVIMARNLARAVDDSLQLSATQAIAAVNIENGQINFLDSIPADSALAGLRERGITIRILNESGTIMQAFGPYRALPVLSPDIAAARAGHTAFRTASLSSDPHPVRWFTAPMTQQGRLLGIVQVAQTLGSVQEPLERLLWALLVSIPVLIGLAAFGGNLLAARALAPIDQITRTAQRISVDDLQERLNLPATDDEVGRLASTFDRMLARLDDSFQRERRFTADASHELRTPLTAMQTILSVMRERRRTPAEYADALNDLAAETARLRVLTEDLLSLARRPPEDHVAATPVDLTGLLQDVAEILTPLAAAKGLVLATVLPNGLWTMGDRDDLARLFVNLTENAVKYTDCGQVTLGARLNGDVALITVSDTGKGIAAAHLPRLFDRFYRVDTARSEPGTGLGLSIAQEIASRHGGRIEVDSTPDAGTSFVVRLPHAFHTLPGRS